MPRRPLPPTLFALALSAAVTTARADTVFTANLTQDQEAPPVTAPLTTTGDPRPISFGTASFVLNAAQTQLSMTATIYNIDVTSSQTLDTNDNLINAHIHVGAAPGFNAAVRWGFFGSPDNDTNPDQLVVDPFASGVGGTFTSVWDLPEGNGGTNLTTNLPGIFAGLSYINFHTIQFPGGEIRGQIVPVPTPAGAPAALALLATLAALHRPGAGRRADQRDGRAASATTPGSPAE